MLKVVKQQMISNGTKWTKKYIVYTFNYQISYEVYFRMDRNHEVLIAPFLANSLKLSLVANISSGFIKKILNF